MKNLNIQTDTMFGIETFSYHIKCDGDDTKHSLSCAFPMLYDPKPGVILCPSVTHAILAISNNFGGIPPPFFCDFSLILKFSSIFEEQEKQNIYVSYHMFIMILAIM